jgi:hypothetical protein
MSAWNWNFFKVRCNTPTQLKGVQEVSFSGQEVYLTGFLLSSSWTYFSWRPFWNIGTTTIRYLHFVHPLPFLWSPNLPFSRCVLCYNTGECIAGYSCYVIRLCWFTWHMLGEYHKIYMPCSLRPIVCNHRIGVLCCCRLWLHRMWLLVTLYNRLFGQHFLLMFGSK